MRKPSKNSTGQNIKKWFGADREENNSGKQKL
jgi:hypothetical protein